MGDCCKLAFFKTTKATGREIKLKDLDCYVTGSENAAGALVMVADIFGWKLNNARVLADQISKEAGIAVYLPDLFLPDDHAPYDPEERAKWDQPAFMQRNPPTNFTKLETVAYAVLQKHKKLGAMGYCWGAQGSLHLGSKSLQLASAVGFAHPVLSDTKPFENLAMPALFLCCAVDRFLGPELRREVEQVMFKKADDEGLISKFVLYPGTAHGDLSRGDEKSAVTARAMGDAMKETAEFFKAWLN
ncbi:MAG: hypothetical protein CYPHOPRED_003879 [Cyphobasidiales sp. Tagirdzhanova-0007]|nr:MAG: hypothetical protein CYPHOPRED_003879 [Cyphobasidiales sp. Tagirdzhanova-0007]